MDKIKTLYRRTVLIGLLVLVQTPLSWANLSNTASATYKDALSNTYNANSNQVIVTVTTPPTLVITKSANPVSVATGGTVTFTIAYQNSGGNATNVVISDAIPAGSTLVAGSITNAGVLSGNTITWTIGNVNAGVSGSVSFGVTAN